VQSPVAVYADDLEIVSPELVLVSPELAAVTWRREAMQPPRPARRPVLVHAPAPPRQARAPRSLGQLLAVYAAVAIAGLAAALITFGRTHHGSVLPPVTSAGPGLPAVSDILSLQASSTGRIVHLRWQPSPDARLVVVVRTPGRAGRRSSVIYRGTKHAVTDRTVSLGKTYRYVVYGVRGGRRSPGALAVVRP
jgi:hypothetical protein